MMASKGGLESDRYGERHETKTFFASQDNRTPKRLKSMAPDLTVVVGGIVFYHYKSIVCSACPFMDVILSKEMKEAHDSEIEFPDKDPNEWLVIYNLLDPPDGITSDDILLELAQASIEHKKGARIIAFLDFLCLEETVAKYDKLMAKQNNESYIENNSYPCYEGSWKECKHLPCPMLKKIMKESFKFAMIETIYWLSKLDYVDDDDSHRLSDIKGYLLDDECGDEMWHHLLKQVEFPGRMLKELNKESIVNSNLFEYILGLCGNCLEEPDSYEYPCPEDLED